MKTTSRALLLLSFLALPAKSAWAMQFISQCLASLDESDSTVYKTGLHLFKQISYYGQEYRNSQLFKAIEHKDPEALYYALEKGAHINACDKAGKTPLIRAIEAGNPVITNAILKNGADINQQISAIAQRQAGMVSLMFACDKADKTNPKDPFSATAAALSKRSVVMIEGVEPWSPKVIQASAGAIAQVEIFQMSWQELVAHKKNMRLCALVVEGGKAPQALDMKNSLLVVGSEGHGISEQWLKDCEDKLTLPMPGQTESLNAAVAGSIALYCAELSINYHGFDSN